MVEPLFHLSGQRSASHKLAKAIEGKFVPKNLYQEAQALDRNIQDIRRKIAKAEGQGQSPTTLLLLLVRQEARMTFLIERMCEAHRRHKADERPVLPDGGHLASAALPASPMRRDRRQRVPFGQTIEPVTFDPRLRAALSKAYPMPSPDDAGEL
jgi:hypothetical protein